ncbi:hypothetical protein GQ53DRAFT_678533 [Thozetella sp. PMI_491]|nr:hypothetical protein GQ53DRAFT_678533 [Thozetella sp. PMI_491]
MACSTISGCTGRDRVLKRPSPEAQTCSPGQRLSQLFDTFWALLVSFVAQVLIFGVENALKELSCLFPASILAMITVFVALCLVGRMWRGLEGFYNNKLRGATGLLNRHMSIGFTIPFMMICRNPLADGHTIGMIIACFALTGVLNTVAAYTMAYPLQNFLARYRRPFFCCAAGEEGSWLRQSQNEGSPLKPSDETVPKGTESQASLVSGTQCLNTRNEDKERPPSEGQGSDATTAEPATEKPSVRSVRGARILNWAILHPVLILCWGITIFVGLPLRLVVGTAVVFETFLLFSIWLSALSVQAEAKTWPRLPRWLRILLGGALNAVLWTSLAMMAYVFAEERRSGQTTEEVLRSLQTNTTVSDLLLSYIRTPNPDSGVDDGDPSSHAPLTMGAGDIALAILNTGLVAWGLKLYEHRRQIFSCGGATVTLVSSIIAVGNVFSGPLLARAVGLRPASRELAFSARSVTIALGSPAVTQLGGDLSLNAAMVVVSGILFQMGLELGLGGWFERLTRRLGRDSLPMWLAAKSDGAPRAVAAGVTIGINSAAMGTAYLYEAKSEAAPYSTLAMTIFGVMTVVLCTIRPVADWVIGQANRE